MGAANTIPQLSECVRAAILEVRTDDQPLRGLLEAIASAASTAASSKSIAPSVKALGRFAVDEVSPEHALSDRISEILGIYQAIVRGERRAERRRQQ